MASDRGMWFIIHTSPKSGSSVPPTWLIPTLQDPKSKPHGWSGHCQNRPRFLLTGDLMPWPQGLAPLFSHSSLYATGPKWESNEASGVIVAGGRRIDQWIIHLFQGAARQGTVSIRADFNVQTQQANDVKQFFGDRISKKHEKSRHFGSESTRKSIWFSHSSPLSWQFGV